MTTRYIETDEEYLELNASTGEILCIEPKSDDVKLKETKIKAYKLLSPRDFVQINGVWEAKRDTLIKILSSLPISYSWKILEKKLTSEYAEITGVLNIEIVLSLE